MAQPAWDQNTWGYDTVQSPYRQGPIYAENDYTLLDQAGEWYQDTTAGVLYYIPTSGQDLTKVDVELPQLQLLLVGGRRLPIGRRPAEPRAFRRRPPIPLKRRLTPLPPEPILTLSRRTISSSAA